MSYRIRSAFTTVLLSWALSMMLGPFARSCGVELGAVAYVGTLLIVSLVAVSATVLSDGRKPETIRAQRWKWLAGSAGFACVGLALAPKLGLTAMVHGLLGSCAIALGMVAAVGPQKTVERERTETVGER